MIWENAAKPKLIISISDVSSVNSKKSHPFFTSCEVGIWCTVDIFVIEMCKVLKRQKKEIS